MLRNFLENFHKNMFPENVHHSTNNTYTLCAEKLTPTSGCGRNFHSGAVTQRVWGTHRESRAPSQPEAERLCRHCLQILTAEMIKIQNCGTYTLILNQSVSQRGLSDIFRGLSPKPMPGGPRPPMHCKITKSQLNQN